MNLLEGKTEIYLSITNNGDFDTTMDAITISFKATDEKNNAVREGSGTFENINLTNSPRQKPADSAIINQSSKIEVLQGLLQWSLPQPYFLYFNKST